MAEGEDRERDAATSGDDEAPEQETAYDPSSAPQEQGDEEESGPAFHPHDRARTERQWAHEDDEPPEPDDPDALGGPSREEEKAAADAGDQEPADEDGERAKGPPPPFRAFMIFVATIVFLILGFLFWSALIAPTYIVALILAALWFVAAYFLLGRLTRRRRHLRFPVRIAFGVTALAVLLWLVISTAVGTTVNEPLVSGQKLSQQQPTAHVPEKSQKAPPKQPTLIATGKIVSTGAGSASGQASFVTLPSGRTKLTLKGLSVTSGPTLHVFLATHDGKSVADSKDLGSLKGNNGDQQYDVPPNVDPRRYKSVVIWCKILGVPFARAETKAQ